MQNKWPKHAWENWDMSAQWMHLGRTRGIQLLKYQIVINVQYTEYEVSVEFVLILSNRR